MTDKLVVCISGKAGYGKSTLAEMLKIRLEQLGKRVAIFNYGDYVKFVSREYYGWDGNKDEKGRSILQKVGTDIGRNNYQNVWIDVAKAFIRGFQSEFDVFIIPDCRFENEINEMEKDFNVMAVRVVRPNYVNENMTEEQLKHSSETELDNFDFDYYFVNFNFNSQSDLNKFMVDLYFKANALTPMSEEKLDYVERLDTLVAKILGR